LETEKLAVKTDILSDFMVCKLVPFTYS